MCQKWRNIYTLLYFTLVQCTIPQKSQPILVWHEVKILKHFSIPNKWYEYVYCNDNLYIFHELCQAAIFTFRKLFFLFHCQAEKGQKVVFGCTEIAMEIDLSEICSRKKGWAASYLVVLAVDLYHICRSDNWGAVAFKILRLIYEEFLDI